MVKRALDDGAPVAPFLMKCYDMVDDTTTDDFISWCIDGRSFLISDVALFQAQLLPNYFKHSNFASFIRQLNIYGFRKIDTDNWIFANDGFIKGQKNLLKTITRRKQSQPIVRQKTPSQQKEGDAIKACEEEKKLNGLWSKVECLKADKNLLMQELAKLRLHQESSHAKLAVLREQIKGMEKDQQQMLSFIVMAMQNPGFLVHILQPKEPKWRRDEASKGVFNRVIDDDLEEDAPFGEGMIVRYQPPVNESPTQLNVDNFLVSDVSNDELKDLFVGIDFPSEPMDEDLFASETCGPIVIPDQVDYSALERFLFSSPVREDKENGNFDDGEWETETTLAEAHNSQLESLGFGCKLQKDQKLEILTERMGNLASECNIKQ